MRKALISAAALATLVAAAGIAEAGSFGRPCTTSPEAGWLSAEALKAKVEALGYKVEKSKVKNACGEFYVRDAKGAKSELFVDPATGDIVGRN